MTNESHTVKVINKTVIARDYYSAMHDAFHSMQQAFDKRAKEQGLTQEKLAILLGIDKGLVSKRLRGTENLTLRTMAGMATAMDCCLKVNFVPHEDMPKPNYRYSDEERNDGWPGTYIPSNPVVMRNNGQSSYG